MKLAAKEDIDAPIDAVFAQLTDAVTLERTALRRGVTVTRSMSGPTLIEDEEWGARVKIRGKQRDITAQVTKLVEPTEMRVHARVGGLEVTTDIELVALSRNRTRMSVKPDLKPKTMSARLLVQSLRLTRSTVERKLRKRIADAARAIETRAG